MEHFIYFKRLCLTLICCLSVSLTSWADNYTKDNIIYSLNEASGTATVKAVTDKSVTSAKIRTRVAGYNMTKIGTNAFEDCTFSTLKGNKFNVLKGKINTDYNNVRNTTYDQLRKNDSLYYLYQQAIFIANKINVTTNISQNTLEQIVNTSYGYHDGLITDASQLSTNALESTEGSLEGLIDADRSTYFHSTWTTGGNINGYHFLQIDLKNAYKQIVLKYSVRNHTTDNGYYKEGTPQVIHIYASNFDIDPKWADLGTAICTYNYDNNKTGILQLNLGRRYRYIRIVVEKTMGYENKYYDRKFFYWSELHAYEANFNNVIPSKIHEDFNLTLEQAKSELDNECATEETIEKLQELIKTFNDAPLIDFAKSEYLTLYSDKALIVPEGLKAAVVLSNGDNVRSEYRYKAGSVIPAHTGVLLKSEKGNSFYMIEGNTDETTPENNLLHGTLNDEMTDVEGAGKYYKLSYDRDTKSIIGFYWGTTDGGAFLNKAGEAFLALPAMMNAQQMKGFALSDLDNGSGNVTGINNVTNATDNAFHAYDLNGRKVDAKYLDELQQGIYIVNGKKIIK